MIPHLEHFPGRALNRFLSCFKSAQTSLLCEAARRRCELPATLRTARSSPHFQYPSFDLLSPEPWYFLSSNMAQFTYFIKFLFIICLSPWNLSYMKPGIFGCFVCWCLEQRLTCNTHTMHAYGLTMNCSLAPAAAVPFYITLTVPTSGLV